MNILNGASGAFCIHPEFVHFLSQDLENKGATKHSNI